MKTILLSFLAVLALAVATFAEDTADLKFLIPGNTYSLTYNDTEESVTAKHLPRSVTILQHAGGSWYFVKAADGRDYKCWLNFASVSTVTSAYAATLEPSSPSSATKK